MRYKKYNISSIVIVILYIIVIVTKHREESTKQTLRFEFQKGNDKSIVEKARKEKEANMVFIITSIVDINVLVF